MNTIISDVNNVDHVFTCEGDAGDRRHIQRRGSGPSVQPDERVCIPRWERQLSIEVDRRIRIAWCSFRKYTLEMYDRPSAPFELGIRMLRAEVLETMLYGCVTWSPRACHYDTLHRLAKAQSRRPLDFLSGHAYQDGK